MRTKINYRMVLNKQTSPDPKIMENNGKFPLSLACTAWPDLMYDDNAFSIYFVGLYQTCLQKSLIVVAYG
jgi:hypothetical protein